MNERDEQVLREAKKFEENLSNSIKETSSIDTCLACLNKLKAGYVSYSFMQNFPALKDNYPLKKSLETISRLYLAAREKAISLGANLDVSQYPINLEEKIK